MALYSWSEEYRIHQGSAILQALADLTSLSLSSYTKKKFALLLGVQRPRFVVQRYSSLPKTAVVMYYFARLMGFLAVGLCQLLNQVAIILIHVDNSCVQINLHWFFLICFNKPELFSRTMKRKADMQANISRHLALLMKINRSILFICCC